MSKFNFFDLLRNSRADILNVKNNFDKVEANAATEEQLEQMNLDITESLGTKPSYYKESVSEPYYFNYSNVGGNPLFIYQVEMTGEIIGTNGDNYLIDVIIPSLKWFDSVHTLSATVYDFTCSLGYVRDGIRYERIATDYHTGIITVKGCANYIRFTFNAPKSNFQHTLSNGTKIYCKFTDIEMRFTVL